MTSSKGLTMDDFIEAQKILLGTSVGATLEERKVTALERIADHLERLAYPPIKMPDNNLPAPPRTPFLFNC